MHLHNQTEFLRLDGIRVALKEGKRRFTTVNGASVSICAGRNLEIIGESGYGKTLPCHCILGLLDQDERETKGSTLFEGHRITAGKNGVRPGFCGTAVSFIAQDPADALDPRVTSRGHFLEMAGVFSQNRQEILEQTAALLIKIGVRELERVLKNYAFQLGGGMLRRVMIALALLGKPRLLITDKPTTASDITTQWKILGLLEGLKREQGLTVLMVSHDLRVIQSISNDLCVMYAGYVIEWGPISEMLENSLHPYMKGLLASRPVFSKEAVRVMEGYPPGIKEKVPGCPFADRCKDVLKLRGQSCPKLLEHGPVNHQVRCFRAGEGRG